MADNVPEDRSNSVQQPYYECDRRRTSPIVILEFRGSHKVQFNSGVIADILAATHAMPSWKACQMENTSWSGTTDENIQRDVSSIGM